MTPELNREYPELDDPQTFEHMAQLTAGHMKPILGHLRRAQHAKATGCVTATFRIADDVPLDLRHGVFRDPGRVFDAIVRFSNAKGKFEKDSVGDARGLAIKLLDVQGTRAMAGDLDTTQDFLMVNHPVFPFPDPKAYVEAMSREAVPLIGGDLLIAAHLALFEPAEFKLVQEIRHKTVSSPLEITYWSGTPFWLGPAGGEGGHAVKYSAVPSPPVQATSLERAERLPLDYLAEALARHLQSGEALFNFRVQLQKNAVEMPVENVSVEWSEADSPPVTVAMLRIGMQAVDGTSGLATKCESMSFNPWHALAEHRPMGGMNRLRKRVYQASVAKRAEAAIGA